MISTVVTFKRPGTESSFSPNLGNPKEWRTSVLVTTTRLTPFLTDAAGVSNDAKLSTSSGSRRWSLASTSSVSLCQFHWFLTTLIVEEGDWHIASCTHNKCKLGKAIVIKINIGINVQVFSNNSESINKLLLNLDNTLNEINPTRTKITNSQTIMPSCKLSNCL